MSVTFTVQPRYFTSTYFATYVLAVEPVHACSFSVTVPQLAFVRAVAVLATTRTSTPTSPARSATTPYSRFPLTYDLPCLVMPDFLASPGRARFPSRGSPRMRPRRSRTVHV